MRTVDRTKKTNIKCEHCKHWQFNVIGNYGYCQIKTEKKNYWNRCKQFEWGTEE